MNYAKHYELLMLKAVNREKPNSHTELHHIVPRSFEDSSDHPSNIVALTIHEHYVAHLLLFKMGYTTQIYSVQAFIQDALNRNRKKRFKHPKLRYKRWIRRCIARCNARALMVVKNRQKIR